MNEGKHATVGGTINRSVSDRITAVGRELAEAFGDLVEAVPGQPRRPQALARELGIGKTVSHRLVTAIRMVDPLATTHTIPGPEPLRRITKAARKSQVAPAIAERAERAIDAFVSLIEDQGGDRSGLDAIISTWLPSARERFEKLAKQTAYRGMHQLRGLAADVNFATHIIHPSPNPEACDAAQVFGYVGLRRIRPDATLKMSVTCGSTNRASRGFTLSQKPVSEASDILWHEYCSQPELPLTLHCTESESERLYEFAWGDVVGPESARNVVMCEVTTGAIRRVRQPGDSRTKASINKCVGVPSKLLVFDLLLHADVYPDTVPTLRTLTSGPYGLRPPGDPVGDCEVLDIVERIEPLGWGIERFRAQEIPNYTEMIRKICGAEGLDPQALRGFRARIEYPVLKSVLRFVIDLPLDPGTSAT